VPKWTRIILLLTGLLTLSCTPPSSTPLGTQSLPYLHPPPPVSVAEEVESLVDGTLGTFESASLTFVEKQARTAAVKVIRPLGDGHGSGTYMRMHGRLVVVTAAHVVGDHTTMIIEGRNHERVVARVVYNDDSSDLAILVTPKLKTRTAIQYRPHKSQQNLIGMPLTYTGFPGHHDLLTIRGYVSSLERGHVVANMFGWFGSSGSGVFDTHGRLVGVVSAIDIGNWYFPLPLDSIVWVAPIWELDAEVARVRIKLAAAENTFGSFPGAAAPRRGAPNPR